MIYKYHGYCPRQGDLVILTFDPQSGREIKKRRPALVVSSTAYNQKVGFVQICPITSTIRHETGYFDLSSSLPVHGQVNARQLRSCDFLSTKRDIKYVGVIDDYTFNLIAQFITYIFDFHLSS